MYHPVFVTWRRHLSRNGRSRFVEKARITERLWRQFFSDPKQWWDHRSEKRNLKFPDFTHKETNDALWLDGRSNPQWIKAELATIPAGTVQRDLYSWNVKLSRSVKEGKLEQTLELFREMQEKGINPDSFTFVPVIQACASLGALEEGSRIHAQIIHSGCSSDVFVGSSLIQMYAQCGCIEDAFRVFKNISARDVVIWTTMINGFVKCGQGQKALKVYRQMQIECVDPDSATFLAVLNACASVGELEEGRRAHEHLRRVGCESDLFIGSSLVDMYTKCGSIHEAWKVFTEMPCPDISSWNAMIHGYVKCCQGQKALELYGQMHLKGLKPNAVTFVGTLAACASVAALEEGRRIHAQIIEGGYESNLFVGSSLVDMYAKCGSVENAWRVFKKVPTRDVVFWNAMLGAYAIHGCTKEAFGLFEQMCEEGVNINRVTFICLLSACSHGGLVEEGIHYFDSLTRVHGIPATVEHYACLVDLLGRGGRLNEANDVINGMSHEPNVTVWKALLSACRVHGNTEIGEQIGKHVIELDPQNSSGYVMLSNICAAVDEISV